MPRECLAIFSHQRIASPNPASFPAWRRLDDDFARADRVLGQVEGFISFDNFGINREICRC